MFEVGEAVFCPLRGCGIVKAIELRTMLNESKEYVIIEMTEPNVVIMVPCEKIGESNFRRINEASEVDKLAAILLNEETDTSYLVDNKLRTKKNREKLASGIFRQCGEVVRDLSCMEHIKALNQLEKTMLAQAKKLLLEELSMIKHISVKEAEFMLNTLIVDRLSKQ